jgi:hypothetical protein
MTNSEIEPFSSYSPSQRTNIYKIIYINYRWDGELMLERGLRPLSSYFPFPSGSAEAQKTACRWDTFCQGGNLENRRMGRTVPKVVIRTGRASCLKVNVPFLP